MDYLRYWSTSKIINELQLQCMFVLIIETISVGELELGSRDFLQGGGAKAVKKI